MLIQLTASLSRAYGTEDGSGHGKEISNARPGQSPKKLAIALQLGSAPCPRKLLMKRLPRRRPDIVAVFIALFSLFSVAPVHGREHKRKISNQDYGMGFSTEITSPEGEVVKAVEAVVNDGVIQGSKEFSKDKYIEKASPADSSPLFPEWKEPGKIYYKVPTNALAPLNFKDSKDEGTVAVRYVVQGKDASKTILRIDAVFVEDFHRTVHTSDGSVESTEFQAVQDQIDSVEAEKKQTAEDEKQRQEQVAEQVLERKRFADEASALAAAQNSVQTLDQHLHSIRRR